jgi:hypothetical protein
MAENQGHEWDNISLKSLEDKLRCLPEVEIPEQLKAKLLAAIQCRQQKTSIGHWFKWHLGVRDLVAAVAAAIFIFVSMLMVSYVLPNPPQTLLAADDLTLKYTMYDQNFVLIKDNNYTSYNKIK